MRLAESITQHLLAERAHTQHGAQAPYAQWDEWRFPVRLYPYVGSIQRTAERPIAIDPDIAFGRPIVRRAGVSTAAIADRIDAGETVAALAEDYDLSVDEIEQAVLYSRAA